MESREKRGRKKAVAGSENGPLSSSLSSPKREWGRVHSRKSNDKSHTYSQRPDGVMGAWLAVSELA